MQLYNSTSILLLRIKPAFWALREEWTGLAPQQGETPLGAAAGGGSGQAAGAGQAEGGSEAEEEAVAKEEEEAETEEGKGTSGDGGAAALLVSLPEERARTSVVVAVVYCIELYWLYWIVLGCGVVCRCRLLQWACIFLPTNARAPRSVPWLLFRYPGQIRSCRFHCIVVRCRVLW